MTRRALRVAEARQRALPVAFGRMRDRWVGRCDVAPSHEPRAEGAARHLASYLLQAPGSRSHGPKATVSVVPTTRAKPPRPTVVCFVRHGTTATTGKVLPGRARGLHLSDKGRDEAARAGESLAGMSVSTVYTSPLERARETASAISKSVGKPVVVERGLIECDFGSWTGEPIRAWPSFPSGRSSGAFRRASASPRASRSQSSRHASPIPSRGSAEHIPARSSSRCRTRTASRWRSRARSARRSTSSSGS